MTISDKVDRIVTHRVLALPIFALVMWLIYALSMGTSLADGGIGIGTFATDWTNDVLFGEWVPGIVGGWLESLGVAGWLSSLILDGIVAGVGAVLGLYPRCWYCSYCSPFWRMLVIWPALPLSWTVSSAGSACPARAYPYAGGHRLRRAGCDGLPHH